MIWRCRQDRDVGLSSAMQYSSQSQSKHSSKLGFQSSCLADAYAKTSKPKNRVVVLLRMVVTSCTDNLLISSGRDTDITGSRLISERDMHACKCWPGFASVQMQKTPRTVQHHPAARKPARSVAGGNQATGRVSKASKHKAKRFSKAVAAGFIDRKYQSASG